mmetsp:Transcript_11223/g.26954  ORF Transcript_11223/g.26954 Transcript_11223/m.26954 type:complete len:238 (+) Transcript_11223:1453-2166(+)
MLCCAFAALLRRSCARLIRCGRTHAGPAAFNASSSLIRLRRSKGDNGVPGSTGAGIIASSREASAKARISCAENARIFFCEASSTSGAPTPASSASSIAACSASQSMSKGCGEDNTISCFNAISQRFRRASSSNRHCRCASTAFWATSRASATTCFASSAFSACVAAARISSASISSNPGASASLRRISAFMRRVLRAIRAASCARPSLYSFSRVTWRTKPVEAINAARKPKASIVK